MSPAYAAARAEESGAIAPAKATPADAFRAARRIFLAGERLDMQALAAELGVARGTLYRWTGDRDRLLADVMVSIAEATIEQAKSNAKGRGARRILGILDYYAASVTGADFFTKFLENDAAVALRILTSRETGVQARLAELIASVIREEEHAGAFDSPIDADTLAYATVRVLEAFLYNDTITGLEPHLDQAHAILELLLRP
jgi:AcrR family transcriptional regulator